MPPRCPGHIAHRSTSGRALKNDASDRVDAALDQNSANSIDHRYASMTLAARRATITITRQRQACSGSRAPPGNRHEERKVIAYVDRSEHAAKLMPHAIALASALGLSAIRRHCSRLTSIRNVVACLCPPSHSKGSAHVRHCISYRPKPWYRRGRHVIACKHCQHGEKSVVAETR